MEDVKKTGPVGLKGINIKTDTPEEVIKIEGTPAYYTGVIPSSYGIGEVIPLQSSTGDLGSSRYDEDILTMEQLEDVENMRARNQSGIGQLINGVSKGGVLAGTTFLNGTLGTLYGIGSAIANIGNKEESGWETFSRIWDNEVANGLNRVNEWAEKVMPNYRTAEEREGSWYQNLDTVNFWADTFLKNMGFTVGAYLSGKGAVGLLSKAGLIKSGLGAATTGAIYGAVNEAAIEANHNSTDMVKLEQQKLNDAYEATADEILNNPNLTLEQKQVSISKLGEQAQALQKQIDEKKAKMGLITFIGNSVFLSLNDVFTLGRLYAKGFHRARKEGLGKIHAEAAQLYAADQNVGKKITREGNKWVDKQITKGEAIKIGVNKSLLEGNEELFQKFISGTAGEKYNTDSPDAYYEALNDADATVKTEEFLDAAIKGFKDSYGNGDSYEEFAVGFLTGALGVPTFGKVNNSDASTYLGRNKTVGLSGGILGELSMANSTNKEIAEAVNFMNTYEQKLANNKKHFIQSEVFTNAMEGWSEANNAFEYKNMEDNDDFVAIARYAAMGKLDYLKELVNQDFSDISDETLSSMIAETSSPYSGYITADGKPDTKRLKEDLEKKKNEILDNINTFENVFLQTQNEVNEVLSPDQMTELAWLKWKQGRFVTRYADMLKEFPKFYTALNENLNNWEKAISQLKAEDINIPGLNNTEKGVKVLKEFLDILNKNSNIGTLAYFLNENKQLLDMISSKEFYDSFGKHNTFTESEFKSVITTMRDVARIASAHKSFDQRYKEFIDNPYKIAKDREDKTQKANATKAVIDRTSAIDKIAKSDVVTMFQQAIDGDLDIKDLSDKVNIDGVEDGLTTEAQEKINKLEEMLAKRTAMLDEIDRQRSSGEIDDVVADDMLAVLDSAFNGMESDDQLFNMDTEAVLDTALDELESDKTKTFTEITNDRQARLDTARSKINQISAKLDSLIDTLGDPTPSAEPAPVGHDATSSAQTVQDRKKSTDKKADEKLNGILEKLSDIVPIENRKAVRDAIIEVARAAKDIIFNGSALENVIKAVQAMPQYKDTLVKYPEVSALLFDYMGSFYVKPTKPTTPSISDKKDTTEELEIINLSQLEVDRITDREIKDDSSHVSTETYGAWIPSTTEYPIYDKRDMTPFYLTDKAREHYTAEQLLRMEKIYRYLKNKGTFALRNTKEIQVGNRVQFAIDPKLNEEVGEPVILLLDNKGRVIGDLVSTQFDTANKQTNLKEVTNNIIAEYEEASKDGTIEGLFISKKYLSEIAQTLPGRVQYTDEYNTLNNIFTTYNAEGGTTEHEFTIAVTVDDSKNMTTTNLSGLTKGADPTNEKIMKPLAKVSKGTPFVLIPTNSNEDKKSYMVVPFNLPNYNENSRNVGLGELVRTTLEKIPTISNKNEAFKLALELSEHTGKTWTTTDKNGNPKEARSWDISFTTRKVEANGITHNIPEITLSYKPAAGSDKAFSIKINPTTDPTEINAFVKQVEDEMIKAKVPFRINRKYINGKINGESYNNLLGKLAKTNILPGMITTVNNWFTVSPVDINGNVRPVGKIKSTRVNPSANTSKPSTKTISFEGKNGVTFKVDSQYNITDSNGKVYDAKDPKNTRLVAHAYGLLNGLDMTKPYQFKGRTYNPTKREFVIEKAEDTTKSSEKQDNVTTSNLSNKETLINSISKKWALNTPKRKTMINALTEEHLATINSLPKVIISNLLSLFERKFDKNTGLFNLNVDDEINKRKPKAMEVNTDTNTTEKIDVNKEVAWLEKVLPQFKDKISLVEGLIRLKNGVNFDKAYGLFYNGTIILSNVAVKGTLYHETFHAVTDVILTDSERAKLFEEARKLYGDRLQIALEELLAEDFRKYMLAEDVFGGKFVKFFRKIKHYIQSFFGKESYINSLYYNISRGNFTNREISRDYYNEIEDYHSTKYEYNNLTSEDKSYVNSIGFTTEEWNNLSRETKEAIMECR